MKASICIATYNKPHYLKEVLGSVFRQKPPFDVEVIVADDGSTDMFTREVCGAYPVDYVRINREPGYRNPSIARNVAYKRARGDIVICQSDDVVHANGNTIEQLVHAVTPGMFALATVINTDWEGNPVPCNHPRAPHLVELVGRSCPRPLFFLGALARKDLYAIGGCEERFVAPGRDDVYFADCLIKGLGLRPQFLLNAVGWHLHHERPPNIVALCEPSHKVYKELVTQNRYVASGGPWPWEE